MVAYAYKVPSLFQTPAQQAGERLAALEEANSGLTAKIIVDDARPVDSLLHPDFEWNDGVAGELWREQTARQLLRCIVVVNTPEPNENEKTPEPVRAFANVTVEDGRRYVSTAYVVADADLYEQVITEILRSIAQYRRKLEQFKNFYLLESAFDEFEAAIRKGYP